MILLRSLDVLVWYYKWNEADAWSLKKRHLTHLFLFKLRSACPVNNTVHFSQLDLQIPVRVTQMRYKTVELILKNRWISFVRKYLGHKFLGRQNLGRKNLGRKMSYQLQQKPFLTIHMYAPKLIQLSYWFNKSSTNFHNSLFKQFFVLVLCLTQLCLDLSGPSYRQHSINCKAKQLQ